MRTTNLTSFFLFVLAVCYSQPSLSQEHATIDSMKRELGKSKTAEDKVRNLDVISRSLMSVNLQEAESYGKQLIEVAEESRERELMVKAYLSNGVRCSYWAGMQDYTQKARGYFNKAEQIAKENRLEKYVVSALLKKAALELKVPDKEKAGEYAAQAASKASTINDDSVQTRVLNTQADVLMAKNSKIEALRLYLNALRLAEDKKNDRLIRDCYVNLAGFYTNIEDFDRAIDYYTLAFKKLDDLDDKDVPYMRVTDVNRLGTLYAAKKSYDLAIKYYERSIEMADSLKYNSLKMPAYVSLLNVYIQMKEPQKSMEFMQSASGEKLQTYFAGLGMKPVMDQAYAIIYSEMGKLDSAGKYFQMSAPYFAAANNWQMKMNNNLQTAFYYKKTGAYQQAIQLLEEVQTMAEANGQLEIAEETSKHLDTLYRNIGDYKTASEYSTTYYQYKDSLQKINKEKELAQVEAQDEQERLKRAAEIAAERKRQRNNIQYLGITIGIVTIFILLVIFGMFKVSAGTIKMIGFFAFIMFFEFIFLIFKKNIYAITKGEPWMDLMFMIALAAVLLPLHHWLEHKVLHYLTSQNRLTSAGTALREKIFRRPREVSPGG